jgi:chromatin segregation and condensation protein Rec8/ScpA/Scc1 (kleisin family)
LDTSCPRDTHPAARRNHAIELHTQHAEPKKRAAREDLSRRRAASALAYPVARQVPYWQVQIAKLISSAERARERNEVNPAHAEELQALEMVVRTQLSRFGDDLISAPEAIRNHSRIEDIFRAGQTVLAGIDRAKSLLAPSPRERR